MKSHRLRNAALVPQTRSSHTIAASAIAHFGFKSGTRIIELLVSLLIPKFASGGPRGCANFAIGTLAAIACAQASTGAALADPTGTWLDKDGCTLHIHACGEALCGTIASLKPRLDPATGQPWTDKKNADPGKRGRPLLGVRVLISMRPNGAGKWSGRLYNADDGNTYAGNLIELGPQSIRVEGCLLGMCDGERLTRVGAHPVAGGQGPVVSSR
jgi:uncharacterized protein (DUF2147 family)